MGDHTAEARTALQRYAEAAAEHDDANRKVTEARAQLVHSEAWAREEAEKAEIQFPVVTALGDGREVAIDAIDGGYRLAYTIAQRL